MSLPIFKYSAVDLSQPFNLSSFVERLPDEVSHIKIKLDVLSTTIVNDSNVGLAYLYANLSVPSDRMATGIGARNTLLFCSTQYLTASQIKSIDFDPQDAYLILPKATLANDMHLNLTVAKAANSVSLAGYYAQLSFIPIE